MRKLLAVCGATATGKTALAVECAKRLNGEIVSCDAFLVYRGLDVGTAKPTAEERGGIPHYMIDVCSPTDAYSVSDFERAALPIVEDILARGKTPILCGGTGFYMNALLFKHAFGETPADPAVREKYLRIAEREGKEALHAMLAEADAESARVLHANDVKRVVRALEIFELTGKKKSEQRDGAQPRFPFCAVAFDYPRETLYARIDARVDGFFARGLVEEVKGLLAAGVPSSAQSMQAIGYKEVVECLKNGDNLSTMSDIIKKNTRNYAKRQCTFFKKMPNLLSIAPKRIEDAAKDAEEFYGR